MQEIACKQRGLSVRARQVCCGVSQPSSAPGSGEEEKHLHGGGEERGERGSVSARGGVARTKLT